MLFILPAPNVYEAQGRVCGHKHTPTSRESLKKLKPLIPRLRELGVTKVISSDLDAQSGDYIARRLGVPHEEWPSLRRWNAGKLHGATIGKFTEVYSQLERDEVPMKGGDSKASFDKRVAHTKQRLASTQQNALVIASSDFIGTKLEPYRVYNVELN